MKDSIEKQLKKERYINSLLLLKIEAMQKLLDVQELVIEGLTRNKK